MQLVQTRRLLVAPLTSAFTFWRFTFQRRRVTLCACEMLLPNCGPLPQTSHTCAIVLLQILSVFRAAAVRVEGSFFGSAMTPPALPGGRIRPKGRSGDHWKCRKAHISRGLPKIQYNRTGTQGPNSRPNSAGSARSARDRE